MMRARATPDAPPDAPPTGEADALTVRLPDAPPTGDADALPAELPDAPPTGEAVALPAELPDAPPTGEADALPDALRRETPFEYDAERYPFAALAATVLGVGDRPLDRLHETDEACDWLRGCRQNDARSYAMRRNFADKRFKQANSFRSGGALAECYERFVREVVAPQIELALPGASATLLYQREPNFRCHLPGTGHLLVHRHRDADYHHQPHEINYWLALTPTFGSNTLFCEGAPGRGDFRPFELKGPGAAMRFWGYQCEHYTVPNDTGATRVSIDFRVIPGRDLYRERYPNSHRSDNLQRFADGAFFASLDGGGDRRHL